MTTRREIEQWFDRGVAEGATHLIVCVDRFDYEDYPVFVKSKEDAMAHVAKPGDMQGIMEVYNLSMDKETQLKETRARNF
jgi:hypothetical protein